MTELERHLLGAFERLEQDYSKRENELYEALATLQRDLSESLDFTRKQLETTTRLCADLTRYVSDLSAQLEAFQQTFIE